MRVMMILKSDAQSEAGAPPSEQLLTAMGSYNEQLLDAGVLLGGEGVHPSSKGVKIRIAKGKLTVTDGPFAEAKEVIGGYFVLQTASLAEAIEWAKRLPQPDYAAESQVELRPMYEPEDFPLDVSEHPAGRRDRELEQRAAPPLPGPEQGPRWLSLLMADKHTEAGMAASAKLLQEMGALIQEMTDKGILISGEGLKPSSQGARVHIANEKSRVTDGPFAEAKELIAGITLFRAQSKAEAVEWARRCLQIHIDGTGIDSGEIQLFPVYETDDIAVTPDEVPGGWRDREQRLRARLGR